MKNLFYGKGKTNWAGVVLISSLIGALSSWIIIFMSDSVLEISSPDELRYNNTEDALLTGLPIMNSAVVPANYGNSGICGYRITGRVPNTQETRECKEAGGEVVCGTQFIDYVDRPGTSENFCDCECGTVQ